MCASLLTSAEFSAAVQMWVNSGQKSENLQEAKEHHKSFRLPKDDAAHSNVSYGAIEAGKKSAPADEEEEEQEEEYCQSPQGHNPYTVRKASGDSARVVHHSPADSLCFSVAVMFSLLLLLAVVVSGDLSENELKVKACLLLLFGTLCVTIFSDPMVDVITQVGDRLAVSPFYIAFVVTPLASNASEVYAGLLFAKKKTNESISMTLATSQNNNTSQERMQAHADGSANLLADADFRHLCSVSMLCVLRSALLPVHGAATMNNTLALSIFMAIIYVRGLEWEYTAEVATVMMVVIVVGLQGLLRRNIFLWQALLVIMLYPLSILFVYTLEAGFGLK